MRRFLFVMALIALLPVAGACEPVYEGYIIPPPQTSDPSQSAEPSAEPSANPSADPSVSPTVDPSEDSSVAPPLPL